MFESTARATSGRFGIGSSRKHEPSSEDLASWGPPKKLNAKATPRLGWDYWPENELGIEQKRRQTGVDPRREAFQKERSANQYASGLNGYDRYREMCFRAHERGLLGEDREIPPFWPTVEAAAAYLNCLVHAPQLVCSERQYKSIERNGGTIAYSTFEMTHRNGMHWLLMGTYERLRAANAEYLTNDPLPRIKDHHLVSYLSDFISKKEADNKKGSVLRSNDANSTMLKVAPSDPSEDNYIQLFGRHRERMRLMKNKQQCLRESGARALFLLQVMAIMRPEEVQRLAIPLVWRGWHDITHRHSVFAAPDNKKLSALFLGLLATKNKQSYRIVYGTVRAKNPEICAINAVGELLFWKYGAQGVWRNCLPDFKDGTQLMSLPLLRGCGRVHGDKGGDQCGTMEFSPMQNLEERVSEMAVEAGAITGKAQYHRAFGARRLQDNDVNIFDAESQGNWTSALSKAANVAYFFPSLTTSIKQAGFSEEPYFIERQWVSPPLELVEATFPSLPAKKEALKKQDADIWRASTSEKDYRKRRNLAGHYVASTWVDFLAPAFLQDSAALLLANPSFWYSPPFNGEPFCCKVFHQFLQTFKASTEAIARPLSNAERLEKLEDNLKALIGAVHHRNMPGAGCQGIERQGGQASMGANRQSEMNVDQAIEEQGGLQGEQRSMGANQRQTNSHRQQRTMQENKEACEEALVETAAQRKRRLWQEHQHELLCHASVDHGDLAPFYNEWHCFRGEDMPVKKLVQQLGMPPHKLLDKCSARV